MKSEIVEIKVANMQKRVEANPERYRENCFYTKRIVMVEDMPVVEIAPIHPESMAYPHSLWLSPFRLYSFQVSDTYEGEGTVGESAVVGLANVVDAHYGTNRSQGYQSNLSMDSIHKEILLGLASRAMMDAQTCGGGYRFIITDRQLMKDFIDMVVDLVKSYQ
jgi:hypothetical protein